ncbi:hypothetical protein JZ751_011655 [Albula glossodonta]|uniref:Uncharacterized protein n=1 Tax=Albula glossodonta TaxID=121402 RepID=A0A8T2PQC5_9TELE|nr:hypothetical protein JZ751_011655 [Albula glossodonta]
MQTVSPVDPAQPGGLTDRSSGPLKDAIRRMVAEKQPEWDDYLEPILFLFRTSVSPTTKFTPYYLMFSREAAPPSQMDIDLLKYRPGQEVFLARDECASGIMAAMREQQNAVRQLVIANISTAYKQGKKNIKRKGRSMFEATDSLTDVRGSPPVKTVKESQYLTFPVEPMLTVVQNSATNRKDELEYPVLVSSIQ